ncbi:glycoside hydrolase [Microdochium bolleyi]|uniref:alpha-1,2-Mannosidase n=1 Tax=Microdochium bolleyi TaxID=196109 RepID=A0A136JEA4_9PEZI|nr:glycoside hydrolase [Microdochium bolleyi]
MIAQRRGRLLPYAITAIIVFLWLSRDYGSNLLDDVSGHYEAPVRPQFEPGVVDDPDYFWRRLPTVHPVDEMRALPTGRPKALPRIQARIFPKESAAERATRLERQAAVKKTFLRSWDSYKRFAWAHDELTPLTGSSKDPFGGWGATLVDSLDTLLIMGLDAEYAAAARAAGQIDCSRTELGTVNVFETTIRYLGGFLAAYDLSGDQGMLRKAREVGDMLYVAFDTPNRMPIPRWDPAAARKVTPQQAPEHALIAEIGSLCMEFTRLSLITGDPKWFDATERIREALEDQQDSTMLPGMWPISVQPKYLRFNIDNTFGLGAMADSVFEYLPKMTALLGGLIPCYETMYKNAMATALKHTLFRPMTPDNADIRIAGTVHAETRGGKVVHELESAGQHLVCFAGGMLTLGGKLFEETEHLIAGQKLTEGCIWTYNATQSGIMPETFSMVACSNPEDCTWDETDWHRGVLKAAHESTADLFKAEDIVRESALPTGFTKVNDARYILRPEAIESVFVLYRATARRDLLDTAWRMFEAIETHTETAMGNAAMSDVTMRDGTIGLHDSMESFWLGETLKYFYLIFSDPSLISLDEFVFNTEAHPFRRLLR